MGFYSVALCGTLGSGDLTLFWSTRSLAEPISLDNFIEGKQLRNIAERSWSIYSLNGKIAGIASRSKMPKAKVDADLEELNLRGNPLVPKPSASSAVTVAYREVLNDDQAARIASIFEREIALAGYTY